MGLIRKTFSSFSLLVGTHFIGAIIYLAGLSPAQEIATKSITQDFWWMSEYPTLVKKLDTIKSPLWETSYRTGPNRERVVGLVLLKAPDRLVLTTILPKESMFTIDEKTGKRVPVSEVPAIITIRDHDFDGMPDDFHDSTIMELVRASKKEEFTKDGFIKFRNSSDHQFYLIKWSIGIGYAVNHFLRGVDSAYPPEILPSNKSKIKAQDLRTRFLKSIEQMDMIKAQNILNEALEKNPNDPSIIDLLGNLYFAQGEIKQALETYDKAISLDPEYGYTYFDRGSVYLNLDNYDKALRDLRKAVELDSEYAEFRMALGAALFNVNELTEAKEHLLKAVRLDPSLTTARFYLCLTYLKLNEENLAAQQHRWILENDPGSFEAQQIRSILKALPK
ncbi:MAG TPA: tetratricopeptide repeat protein [Desulfatiglandales bacterium]|nr:tetratricopeptide repeat protein [Desulfatiglandales bacterium]